MLSLEMKRRGQFFRVLRSLIFAEEREYKGGEIGGKLGHPFWREIKSICADFYALKIFVCERHKYNFGGKCKKSGKVLHLSEFKRHRATFLGSGTKCKTT